MLAVYLIRNSATDKVYVGSTNNPKKRWTTHLRALRTGRHHSIHLQRAFAKHGAAAFSFHIVEAVQNSLFLRAREQFWLWRHSGKLYNRSLKTDCPGGVPWSDEQKQRMSKRMRGNTIRRGSKFTAEQRAVRSAILIGNQRRRGVPHDEATKAKIAASLRAAYAEGRHKAADPAISRANIAEFNRRRSVGEANAVSNEAA